VRTCYIVIFRISKPITEHRRRIRESLLDKALGRS